MHVAAQRAILFGFSSYLLILATFSHPLCKDGFYNERTQKCDDCTNACYSQQDESLCKTNCPGFLKQSIGRASKHSTNCDKGFYFDPHVGSRGKCEPCTELCFAHTITKTTRACKTKCPDEYAAQQRTASHTLGVLVTATEPVNTSNNEQSSKQKQKPSFSDKAVVPEKESKTEGNTAGLIIAVACLACVIFVGLVLAGVYVRHKNASKPKDRPVDYDENNTTMGRLLGGKPVQESGTDAEKSELVLSEDRGETMAFSELCESYHNSFDENHSTAQVI